MLSAVLAWNRLYFTISFPLFSRIILLFQFNFPGFFEFARYKFLFYLVKHFAWSIDVRLGNELVMVQSVWTLMSVSKSDLVSTEGFALICWGMKCTSVHVTISIRVKTVSSKSSRLESLRPQLTSLLHLLFVFSSCSVSHFLRGLGLGYG